MTDKEIIYGNVERYLKGEIAQPEAHGTRFALVTSAESVWEIEINKFYFISIGKLADDTFEVFTLHYNKDTKTSWKDWSIIPAEKDHLCQHKCFTSFRRALNYAFKAAEKGITPREINQIW